MQTFNKLIQRKIDIEKQVDFFSNYLQKFPINELGLITEKCEKYKFAKKGFEHWFKKLQDINIFINRIYKKEYKNYRLEKIK
jgi:predicted transcriptional regulator